MSDILQEAERLQRALRNRQDFRDAEINLEAAAVREAARHGFRTTGTEAAPPASDALLRDIVVELHEGNVLVAAAMATPEDPRQAADKDALMRLDATIEQLREATEATGGGVRHGFRSAAAPEAPALPSEPKQATEQFVMEARATLEGFEGDSESVVNKVFEKLLAMASNEQVKKALEQLTSPVNVPAGGKTLLQRGVETIRSAIERLREFLSLPALASVKQRLESWWTDVTEGKWTRRALRFAFGSEQIESRLTAFAAGEAYDRQKLQGGANELYALRHRFKSNMDLLGLLLVGVGGAAAVLAWAGVVAGPQLILFTALAYGTALAAVVVLGREYTGTQEFMPQVRGVGPIIEQFSAAAQA